MGANNSTRRVSFESDEKENVTVVKGIRLSENVIKRMKEPASPPKQHTSKTPAVTPPPPVVDPITSLPPPPPLVEPVAPSAAPPAPSATESMAAPSLPPPPPPKEQVAAPTIIDIVLPAASPPAAANTVAAPAFEPLAPPPPAAVDSVTLPTSLSSPPAPPPFSAPAVEETSIPQAPPPLITEPSHPPINRSILNSPPIIEPIAPPHVIEPLASSSLPEPTSLPPPSVKNEPIPSLLLPESEPLPSPPLSEPVTILPASIPPSGYPQPAEPFPRPPLPEFIAPCEPLAPPPQPTVEPLSPAPVLKPVAVSESSPAPSATAAPAVDKEALKKKITDELYKDLEQEKVRAEQDMQAWFDAEKVRISAQAQAEAQAQFRDEVSKILTVERAVAQESLQQAIIRERINTEDERLRTQLFAKQLEAREADLKKQDAFYREQVARLEERSAQFYKVTTENYHQAADQMNAKFKRYEVYPVCTDLQGQILACYKDNVGKTLNCSNIAARYLQCVNEAKQNKLRTGG
ncbi:coiled-coil-helix-coiled-coil-helix domain containing 3a [Xenentodon cancila]